MRFHQIASPKAILGGTTKNTFYLHNFVFLLFIFKKKGKIVNNYVKRWPTGQVWCLEESSIEINTKGFNSRSSSLLNVTIGASFHPIKKVIELPHVTHMCFFFEY
jgi:hypothetical protein